MYSTFFEWDDDPLINDRGWKLRPQSVFIFHPKKMWWARIHGVLRNRCPLSRPHACKRVAQLQSPGHLGFPYSNGLIIWMLWRYPHFRIPVGRYFIDFHWCSLAVGLGCKGPSWSLLNIVDPAVSMGPVAETTYRDSGSPRQRMRRGRFVQQHQGAIGMSGRLANMTTQK